MLVTDTLEVGQVLWTRGQGDFGDNATGGVFIRSSHDPETGEQTATLLTYQAAKPRQGSLHLLQRGANRDLGLVARLIRVPVSEISPPMDEHRDWNRCHAYSLRALIAAALPPNHEIGTHGHDALVDAYRILHNEAIALRQGGA